MQSNYLTSRDAADMLGVSVPTIQQWVERGLLTAWKTEGGHRRIAHASVSNVLRQRLEEAQQGQRVDEFPVLIVEDDAALLKLYKHQIARWPFKTTLFAAPNGYEALVLMGEAKPALLICDLRLPGINGFQIVRALCAMPRFRDMGIVVISGLPGAEIEAHGGLPARVQILGKPVDFGGLAEIGAATHAAIHRALNSS